MYMYRFIISKYISYTYIYGVCIYYMYRFNVSNYIINYMYIRCLYILYIYIYSRYLGEGERWLDFSGADPSWTIIHYIYIYIIYIYIFLFIEYLGEGERWLAFSGADPRGDRGGGDGGAYGDVARHGLHLIRKKSRS